MANAKDQNKLPAVVADQSYPVLTMDPDKMQRVIRANIGNSRMNEFDVDRISVPPGGGIAWNVPTLEGIDSAKEIEGVVVFWKEPRAFWRINYDDSGGGTPPACQSDDGTTGVGDPGGQCGVCPLAQFGTHHKGRGQACKQMRILFVIREQEFLPIAISCPPTSLDNMRKYFLRLAGRGILFNHVVTRFVLAQERNRDGVGYSVIVPSMTRMLNDIEIESIERYCEAIAPALAQARVVPAATEFAG